LTTELHNEFFKEVLEEGEDKVQKDAAKLLNRGRKQTGEAMAQKQEEKP
jgi:hypothetical protein